MKPYFSLLRVLIGAIALCAMPLGFAQNCANLPTVSDLFREDQADLQLSFKLPPQSTATQSPEFAKIKENRRARAGVLDSLIACDKITSAGEWQRAAIIVGQSGEEGDLFKSIEFANRALAIDPQLTAPKKMIANSWDRILLGRGLAQWYGTQWDNGPNGSPTMKPIARCVISNKTRREFNIEESVIASQPEVCPDRSGRNVAESNVNFIVATRVAKK